MPLELPGVVLAHRPAARGLARFVDRLATPGNQVMPLAQRLARRAQPIGASLWQPVEPRQILAVELHAVRHQFHSVLVVEAASIPAIEQLARYIGWIQQAGLIVLELVHAAAPASVAQRFPLAAVEAGQRLLPKWCAHIHDKATLALLTGRNQAGFQRA